MATTISSKGFILTVSFQPNSLGSGGLYRPVPANPVNHLHVDQVEVDRMGVNPVMRNLPKLGRTGSEDLVGRIDVS